MTDRLSWKEIDSLVLCDFASGSLWWKERPLSFFKNTEKKTAEQNHREWNLRNAGKKIEPSDNGNGYFRIFILGKHYYFHRVIFSLYHKREIGLKMEIDHEDGDGHNNRIDNLKQVTCQGNMRNCGVGKNNSSGTVGVLYIPKRNKWLAQITIDYRNIFIGHFDTRQEAEEARRLKQEENAFHQNHGTRLSFSNSKEID